MALRWYLFPIETVNGVYRVPKYIADPRLGLTGVAPASWRMMDYGLMPTAIMLADVTTAQHNTLTANADVRHIVLHANLDNAVGAGAVTAIRNNLEALHIPGQWVQASDTWRNVLRTTMGLFQFAQRVHGRFNVKALPDGYTLATTWSELPASARQFLLDVAAELEIDTSGATGATTLRQIFKAFADAWGDKPILLGGMTI